jgi:glycosyltransferase involved in cell wall biosynthesis
MTLKTYSALLRQRAKESAWLVHGALLGFVAWGWAEALLGRKPQALVRLSQVHRTSRLPRLQRLVEPYIVRNVKVFSAMPPAPPVTNYAKFFGRRLLVLKPPMPNGEKGVLFVSFSQMYRLLPSLMEMQCLMRDYTLVLEPSFPSFCHPDLLKYTQYSDEVFVQAAPADDYAFLARLNSNLVPLEMGPADWVDPRTAEPYLGSPKEFDIIMNSFWGALKRHHVLFRMLRDAKKKYKTLLVGFGPERKYIEDLIAHYGVGQQVTMIEDIPYQKVMELTCRSRVSVLLSLKEGGNRAVAESMFCDVPVVLLKGHVGGVRKNVVPETGLLVEERDLEGAVEQLLTSGLKPRAWAVANISCFRSSEKLNSVLREHALRAGRPWTANIAARSNSPDSSYTNPEDAARLSPWNEKLREYLRPEIATA